MQPDQAPEKDLAQIAKEMTPKQLRKSLKRAYRAEAKKVLGIARQQLHRSKYRSRAIRQIGKKAYVATSTAGEAVF